MAYIKERIITQLDWLPVVLDDPARLREAVATLIKLQPRHDHLLTPTLGDFVADVLSERVPDDAEVM
jgi:hypothetical protein